MSTNKYPDQPVDPSDDSLADPEPPDRQQLWAWVVSRQLPVWSPPTDVVELPDRLVVMVEIAGMQDVDFQVMLEGRSLTVAGIRRLEQTVPEDLRNAEYHPVTYHQMELSRGAFRTHVYLPWEPARDAISAVYRDGILYVVLPRQRRQAIHIVNIDSEDTAR